MQSAAQAYGAVAKQIANPRELEADLLLKAASRLQAVHDAWDRKKPGARRRAALQSQALVDLPHLGDEPSTRCRSPSARTSPISACS